MRYIIQRKSQLLSAPLISVSILAIICLSRLTADAAAKPPDPEAKRKDVLQQMTAGRCPVSIVDNPDELYRSLLGLDIDKRQKVFESCQTLGKKIDLSKLVAQGNDMLAALGLQLGGTQCVEDGTIRLVHAKGNGHGLETNIFFQNEGKNLNKMIVSDQEDQERRLGASIIAKERIEYDIKTKTVKYFVEDKSVRSVDWIEFQHQAWCRLYNYPPNPIRKCDSPAKPKVEPDQASNEGGSKDATIWSAEGVAEEMLTTVRNQLYAQNTKDINFRDTCKFLGVDEKRIPKIITPPEISSPSSSSLPNTDSKVRH